MKSNTDDIKVSIICDVYNHEPYLKECLEGFIKQKTTFKFEILIHDDASTDNSAKIIKEYEDKYPNIVFPIYQKNNQYSLGVKIVKTYQIPRAHGKYVAICEGDDYWIDDCKLQKQYDIMEKHPEVDMCAHSAYKIDAVTKKKIALMSPATKKCVLPIEEVIMGRGGYLATNSLFYRTEIFKNNTYRFREYLGLDYTLQICGALRGGIYYLPECMSVYRGNVPKGWTQKVYNDLQKRLEHEEKVKNMLNILNEETQQKYNITIQKLIHRMNFNILYIQQKYNELFDEQYRDILNELTLWNRLKLKMRQVIASIS